MQDFLKEWGPAIITAIAVFIIIMIVRAMQGQFSDNYKAIMDNFEKTTNAQFNQAGGEGTTPQTPGK